MIGKPKKFNPLNEISLEKERICILSEEEITKIDTDFNPKYIQLFLSENFYKYYPEYVGDYVGFCRFLDQKRSE